MHMTKISQRSVSHATANTLLSADAHSSTAWNTLGHTPLPSGEVPRFKATPTQTAVQSFKC